MPAECGHLAGVADELLDSQGPLFDEQDEHGDRLLRARAERNLDSSCHAILKTLTVVTRTCVWSVPRNGWTPRWWRKIEKDEMSDFTWSGRFDVGSWEDAKDEGWTESNHEEVGQPREED